MSNLLAQDIKKCTGCRTCEQLCPKSCITMQKDRYGFLVPNIDIKKCINCGICVNNCSSNYIKDEKNDFEQMAFAAKSKDDLICKTSSSGGLFYEIARLIIGYGGFVYGCTLNTNLEAEHIEISNLNEISKLQGSKYVQSDTKHTFELVKERLSSDNYVLYVGTACQIQGLKSYLNKSYDKLILVDIICHGVPSPLLFKKYLAWLSQKKNGTIKKYIFRSKKRGWGLTSEATINKKRYYIDAYLDPYYKSFLEQKTYRECCYICSFANKERVSDITLGDFWGVEKFHPGFYSDKGVSAVLVNTKKGQEIFNALKERVEYISTTFDNIANQNHNLLQPSSRPQVRDIIYEDMISNDFEQFVKKDLLTKVSVSRRIKVKIPVCIKKTFRTAKLKFFK